MSKLFISHSSQDHARACELQQALAGFEVATWTDTYDLRTGDRLTPLIQKAIEAATAFAILVSPSVFESSRVGKELLHALAVQKARGTKRYPVIPILLDGSEPSLLDGYLDGNAKHIRWDAGRADAALGEILAAMGLRPPSDRESQEPIPEPLEDLTSHLTDLEADEMDGTAAGSARALLVELMAEIAKQFPVSRADSVDADVELSLHRLLPQSQEKARVLSVFHGGVSLAVLHRMMGWDLPELDDFAGELVSAGLAKHNSYKHISLHPALRPYLRARMDGVESKALETRWAEAMRGHVDFLVQLRSQHHRVAAKLTLLDLPNLFALLAHVREAKDAAAAIALAASLHSLLQDLGKPRLLECVAHARQGAIP